MENKLMKNKKNEIELTEDGLKLVKNMIKTKIKLQQMEDELKELFLKNMEKTGDIIGVKGRLQTRMIDNADGTKHKKVEMIAEKVTFLSSGSKRQEEKMENNDNSDIANNNVQLDENVKEHKKNKK